MFGIIKLTIHTITGMWVSIVLFKLMTNGWSGFYFQCCVLSLVFLTVSWLLSGEWLAGKSTGIVIDMVRSTTKKMLPFCQQFLPAFGQRRVLLVDTHTRGIKSF